MNEFPSATRNVALLIDADNASHHAIDPVLTVLAELGSVNVRRAYGNWRKDGLKGWMDKSMKHGIEPHQQFDITKGKNATDMKMTIDAMDLLFRGRIDGFGIMSSDSDFMPLAMRIRQDGIPVYGFGDTKTPDSFKQACTRFIDVGALLREAKPRPVPIPVAIDVPIEQALPPAVGIPAPRAPAPASAPAPVAPAAAPVPVAAKPDFDPEVLQLLIDAYDASKRDQRGFVSLSAMGQLAANRSSFDVRNYGYKRLSDLIESVPNFQIERREDGRAMVRRLR